MLSVNLKDKMYLLFLKIIPATASLSKILQYCIDTTKYMMQSFSLSGSHIIQVVFLVKPTLPKFRWC